MSDPTNEPTDDATSDPFPAPRMEDVQLVDILRAVSDPTRLQIVQRLADGEPHAKGGPSWDFKVKKSTMAHHFRILREAGVTVTIVDGRAHIIRLRRAELEAKFPGLIDALRAGSN